jgi:hypothetical protein
MSAAEANRFDHGRQNPNQQGIQEAEFIYQAENQPDGEYGWICVAACFIFNAFTWGSVSVSVPKSAVQISANARPSVLRRLSLVLSIT